MYHAPTVCQALVNGTGLVELTSYRGEGGGNQIISQYTESQTEINVLKKSIENHELVSKVNRKEYEDSKRLP